MSLEPVPREAPYTSVGQLIIRSSVGGVETTEFGTAFRVGPNRLLTSAHLLKFSGQFMGGQVIFSLFDTPLRYDVRTVWAHPQYTSNTIECAMYDVGICSLATNPADCIPILNAIGKQPGRQDLRREVVGFLAGRDENGNLQQPGIGQVVSSRIEIDPREEGNPFFYPLHSTEKTMSGGPMFGTEGGRLVIDGIIFGDNGIKCVATPLHPDEARRFLRFHIPSLYT